MIAEIGRRDVSAVRVAGRCDCDQLLSEEQDLPDTGQAMARAEDDHDIQISDVVTSVQIPGDELQINGGVGFMKSSKPGQQIAGGKTDRQSDADGFVAGP